VIQPCRTPRHDLHQRRRHTVEESAVTRVHRVVLMRGVMRSLRCEIEPVLRYHERQAAARAVVVAPAMSLSEGPDDIAPAQGTVSRWGNGHRAPIVIWGVLMGFRERRPARRLDTPGRQERARARGWGVSQPALASIF